MSSPNQPDLFPDPAPTMRSVFRVPALALGAIVLLLLVLLTPLGGFFASVLTYNTWATFLVLAWVILSFIYVTDKARDEESRLFKVAFGYLARFRAH